MTISATHPASAPADDHTISRRSRIVGWVITGVVTSFLLIDAVTHLVMPEGVKDASYDLGFTDGDILTMGLVLLGCLALYLFPRTSILGAVLLTGYFGGAVTALMVDEKGYAAGVFFPILVGALTWAGLWLRSPAVRSVMPLTPR